MKSVRRWVLLVCGVLILGCDVAKTSQLHGKKADLEEIYRKSAHTDYPGRNPVILIHGVLGARLKDSETGQTVWGSLVSNFAHPNTPDGARRFALPMKEGLPLSDLKDSVRPEGILEAFDVPILGIPLKFGAYQEIAALLEADSTELKQDESLYPAFQFAYDWRRSNVENAQRLYRFMQEKRPLIQAGIEKRFGIKNYDVKFDIVAHSMGGLITRYCLRYGDADLPSDGSLPEMTWAGAKYVENAYIVGTPNAGFVDALFVLEHGLDIVPVAMPDYAPALVGTFPSWYEMLPRTRHKAVVVKQNPESVVDLFNLQTWERYKWGLANPEQDFVLRWLLPDAPTPEVRRRIALEHLNKCLTRAQRFQAAMDVSDVNVPQHLNQYLFAGDAEQTDTVFAVDGKTGKLDPFYKLSPGDGLIPRYSALMDERMGQDWQPRLVTPIHWRGVYFLRTDHMGITIDPTFTDNLGYILLEKPRRR